MSGDRDTETNLVSTPEEGRSVNNELPEIQQYVEVVTSTLHELEAPVATTCA